MYGVIQNSKSLKNDNNIKCYFFAKMLFLKSYVKKIISKKLKLFKYWVEHLNDHCV